MFAPPGPRHFWWILPILIAIVLWQLFIQFSGNELLPSPAASFKALYDLAASHILFDDCWASLKRVFIGFCVAAAAGICLGLALGIFAKLRSGFLPIIELLRPIPPIAWIPIAITFFGIGDSSSCFVIFIGAFYPIFTNTLLGVTEIPASYIDAAKLLGASNIKIYKQVIIPCALPSIFAGLTVGLGFAWACVVAAEMIAAHSGLGYEIQLNRQLLQLDRVVAGMAVIGCIGYIMVGIMKWLENKLLPWKNFKNLFANEQSDAEISQISKNIPEQLTNKLPITGTPVVLDNVKFSYGQNTDLIENISLSVKPGEFLSLLGPSGCGKTSLLRLIAGLNQPKSGKILIDGIDAAQSKKELTMVFQNGALFPWLTAMGNIIFALQSQNLSREENIQQAKTLLSIVGLEKHSAKYPGQLSGGQQQRIALARALAYRPRLILMDEPFSALDSQTRESLQQDVAHLLSQMGISIILVTHDIREAVFMSDRVLVLSTTGGQIVQEHTIETPRSKRDDAFRYTPEFSSARASLWQALHAKTKELANSKPTA